MTPYYPTIEEDLKRADEILEKGRGNGEGATIFGVDIHAAYMLLKSFAAHIRTQHRERDAMMQIAKRLNRTAQEQITEAVAARDKYAARAAAAAPQRQGPLATDHPLVHQLCPACLKLIRAGAFVTLVAIGPGEDPEERAKAAAGRPYNAVTVAAHWECVTGQDGK